MPIKNIIVTGGLGYIGSHFISALDSSKYNVICVDNLSNSSLDHLEYIKSIFDKIDFYNTDLLNYQDLIKVCKSYDSIDAIVHFAALKFVDESIQNPNKYYSENINSTLNILKLSDLYKIRKIIFSSSASIYGDQKKQPVNEKMRPFPKSPYAYSKLMCERIIEDYCNLSKFTKAVSLRYFNPIGAHPSLLLGEFSNSKPGNIMQNILTKASSNNDFFSVFGNDYSTDDGTALRDYIHVMDLASAHKYFLDYLDTSNKKYDFFNVGTGTPTSILKLLNSFNYVNNTKINYKFCERRPGDIGVSYSDNTKILKYTNWKPIYSVSEMCFHSFEWFKKI